MIADTTVVLDLDGVLYLDTQGIDGAADALNALTSEGVALVFATNNSTKTAEMVAAHIETRTGFRAYPEQAVTSAMSAGRYAADHCNSVHVLGSDGLRSTLEAYGVTVVDAASAEGVVVGLNREFDYDMVDVAARAIRNGATFIATNVDATYPTPTGPVPGAGAIVAAVATASGVDPIDCGKPTDLFGAVLSKKIRTDSVWMVGDRPETDIAMANALGWTSILALSGVTVSVDEVAEKYMPDHVISSIANLGSLLLAANGSTVKRGDDL